MFAVATVSILVFVTNCLWRMKLNSTPRCGSRCNFIWVTLTHMMSHCKRLKILSYLSWQFLIFYFFDVKLHLFRALQITIRHKVLNVSTYVLPTTEIQILTTIICVKPYNQFLLYPSLSSVHNSNTYSGDCCYATNIHIMN